MLRVLVLVAIVACAFGSALPNGLIPIPINGDERIVGGVDANITDLPYQLSVIYNGSHRCGGSIISNRWAVTAAHCTDSTTISLFRLRAGSNFHSSGGQLVLVSAIHTNEDYDSETLLFDISLLYTATAFIFQSGVQAISLPLAGQSTAAGSNAVISGWGVTVGRPSATLQVINVPVLDDDICNSLLEEFGGMTGLMICAGIVPEGGKEACYGDSGGPMAVDGELIGIISFNYGCDRPHVPGVFIRVAALRNWILEYSGV